MSRYRDNSGVNNTCPKIDEVISAIDSVDWSENAYWDRKNVVGIMEEIRSANSTLRDWGNGLDEEREELTDEVDRLNDEVSRPNDKIAGLESELKYYLKEVDELQNKLESVTA